MRQLKIMGYLKQNQRFINTKVSKTPCTQEKRNSNPSSSANKKTTPKGVVFLLAEDEKGFERTAPVRTLVQTSVRWTLV